LTRKTVRRRTVSADRPFFVDVDNFQIARVRIVETDNTHTPSHPGNHSDFRASYERGPGTSIFHCTMHYSHRNGLEGHEKMKEKTIR
jgi:hypothetical protein